MSKSNNKIITIIILSTIFGLSGGLVGAIIARVYILEKTLKIPFVGEIDFLENNYGNPNIIIQGAKKVVVEQNIKVVETADAVSKSIVGIYKSKAMDVSFLKKSGKNESKSSFDIDNYYQIDKNIGQGFILTSDGWIITDIIPEKIKSLPAIKDPVYVKKKKEILDEYFIVLKEKKVYPVDDIVLDSGSGYAFWHITANDLPVRGFSSENEIKNGQLVVAVNWGGWIWLTNIIGRFDDGESVVHNSDEFLIKLLLSVEPGIDFNSSFLFDLNGNLIALIDKKGSVDPVYKYTAVINHLLRFNSIRRASLGVNYIDISELINTNSSNGAKGALIYKDKSGVAIAKGSPAALAGLREGDIITMVDNVELNNNTSLNSAIVQKVAGDEIGLEYLRQGEISNIRIELDELKK